MENDVWRADSSPERSSLSIGLENCITSPPKVLRGARFGLLSNQASVDRRFRYSHDLLSRAFPGRLAALFSPQCARPR